MQKVSLSVSLSLSLNFKFYDTVMYMENPDYFGLQSPGFSEWNVSMFPAIIIVSETQKNIILIVTPEVCSVRLR